MDVFPAYEVSVAVITFVLGFVSARHHAQLSAARQLVADIGQTLTQGGAGFSRDQVDDLVELTQSGFRRDMIVDVTIGAAAVVASSLTVLLFVGVAREWFGADETGAVKGVVAVLLAWLVTGLGAADARSVRRNIAALRDGTTVGLLSDAEEALASHRHDRAIELATLAATRTPDAPLALLIRARGRVERLEELDPSDEADVQRELAHIERDVGQAAQTDPLLVAGMLDWLIPAMSVRVPQPLLDHWISGPIDARTATHIRRRLMSHSHGAVRRLVLGRRSESSWTDEELASRVGRELVSTRGVCLLRASREGRLVDMMEEGRRVLADPSSPPVDVLAAANATVVMGAVSGPDPLEDSPLLDDPRWRPWVQMTRADWAEAAASGSDVATILSDERSGIHVLRAHVAVPNSATRAAESPSSST